MLSPFAALRVNFAKNLGSCGFNELRRSFLRCAQDRLRLLRMTLKRVFCTLLVLQDSADLVLAEFGATPKRCQLNQKSQPYNCSA